MKKTAILCLAFTAMATLVKAQHPFTIEGQLAPDKHGFVILDYSTMGKYTRDSAVVTNGKFTFKGTLGDPVYATLNLNPVQGYVPPGTPIVNDLIKLFIEGNTTVKSNAGLKTADIKGSKTEADYLKRDALYKPLNSKLETLNTQMRPLYEEKNIEAMKPIKEQINVLLKQAQDIDSTFIRQNPDSYVSFDIWRSKHSKGFVKPEWRSEFERFSKRIRNTEEGKLMGEKIERADQLRPGNIAPMFTLKDLSGKAVSLSDFKGKNVLLVFWYRHFYPFETFSLYLRRAEKRLKDKNTVIVGISYDDDATWRAAATQEFPEWIHLNASPERISANEMGATAVAYGVYTGGHLPAAYLIGPDGKIVMDRVNLNDTELGAKLEKLLNNHLTN